VDSLAVVGLFLTYKGFGPSGSRIGKAGSVKVASVKSALSSTHQYTVLADATLNDDIARFSGVDTKKPFSSVSPLCGLIDLTSYHVYPLEEQDLTDLKTKIHAFVMNTTDTIPERAHHEVQENEYNIILEKVMPDRFRSLVCLPLTIQCGQTLQLKFQSLDAFLRTAEYENTPFSSMHIIDEAIRLLCLEDLRSLLVWLNEDLLRSILSKSIFTNNSTCSLNFEVECGQRRKLHWVTKRLCSAFGDNRLSEKEKVIRGQLNFGRNGDDDWNLKSDLLATMQVALRTDISKEILWRLDWDEAFGRAQHSYLCIVGRELLESSARAVAEDYISTADSELGHVQSLERVVNNVVKSIGDIVSFDKLAFRGVNAIDNFMMAPFSKEIQRPCSNSMQQELTQESSKPSTIDDVIVCTGDQCSEMKAVVLRRIQDVQSGRFCVSLSWYNNFLCQIVSSVARSFHSCLDPPEREIFDIKNIFSIIRSNFAVRVELKKPKAIRYNRTLFLPKLRFGYIPESYGFFLGIVWPALRKSGWSLAAGNSEQNIQFILGPKNRKRLNSANSKLQKKKAKLADNFKLGNSTRTTKRLLNVITTHGDRHSTTGERNSSAPRAKHILESFQEYIHSRANAGDEVNFTGRLQSVCEAISSCFNNLSPLLFALDDTSNGINEGWSRPPIEVLSSAHFLQFLSVFPIMIKRTNLSPQETSDCESVTSDMLKFVAANPAELVGEQYQLIREELVDSDTTNSRFCLESKLNPSLEGSSDAMSSSFTLPSGREIMNEMIREEDKGNVTDFICCVMEQAMPIWASHKEALRKGGRVEKGSPGMACRNCAGKNNEGRYFFSSVESLTACYTALERHYIKCPLTPQEVKQRIEVARTRHSSQRKALGQGTQQAFFNGLWRRLHINMGLGASENTANQQEDNVMEISDPSSDIEYTDHISVLDYARKGKSSKELHEALERYYSCLDYMGRVYKTDAMRGNFSEEWLLAKVLPKERQQTSRLFVG
jgi:hypothetical protein